MKQCIILTHGPIGEALIAASESITGEQEGLHHLSVTEMSVTEIHQRLEALVNGPAEQDGVCILASLKGGSCWNVAAAVAKGKSNVTVVSGANLPMILSFIMKRDSLNLTELTKAIERDGLRGIKRLKI
jgi:mannose/fructose-specific phosphotransferase system component IIA